MNNVEVINISSDRELLLGFLRPTYTIATSPSVTSNFILHRDIKSKMEREALSVYYSNCVFISKQIFDEVWDDQRIVKEVIDVSHKFFKNRKTKFEPSAENFNQDCINFLYGISTDEDESSIMELFESFGSISFIQKFVKYTERVPYQQATTALLTFLSKIKKSSTSMYYRKKAILFEDTLKKNKVSALTSYAQRSNDTLGLSECKLFVDLMAK